MKVKVEPCFGERGIPEFAPFLKYSTGILVYVFGSPVFGVHNLNLILFFILENIAVRLFRGISSNFKYGVIL